MIFLRNITLKVPEHFTDYDENFLRYNGDFSPSNYNFKMILKEQTFL